MNNGDKVVSVTVETYFWRIFHNILVENQISSFFSKICQKYISAVTEITLSRTGVPSSPGWHMKDNGHTYIFRKVNIFDNKSSLGARLDKIRLLSFIMDLLSQFSVDF